MDVSKFLTEQAEKMKALREKLTKKAQENQVKEEVIKPKKKTKKKKE